MNRSREKQTSSSWVTIPKPCLRATMRLFCLPYAGGSTATYYPWADQLPHHIEVCPIQLPGRGHRLREQPFSELPPLVSTLGSDLAFYLDRPFALFGHSMGSFIAFELAQHLRHQYGIQPSALFISGRRPVHLLEPYTHIRHLPEQEFLQALHRRYGMLQHILNNQDLSNIFLPILRADFSICETYRYSSDQPFSCPIFAYGGLSDRDVCVHELASWRRYTQSIFRMNLLTGGHFFIETHQTMFLHVFRRDLAMLLDGRKNNQNNNA